MARKSESHKKVTSTPKTTVKKKTAVKHQKKIPVVPIPFPVDIHPDDLSIKDVLGEKSCQAFSKTSLA